MSRAWQGSGRRSGWGRRLAGALLLGAGLAGGTWAVSGWLWRPAPPAPVAAVPVDLPSGQEVTLIEALWEDQDAGLWWLRLRYLAPAIGGGAAQVDAEAATGDMLALCRRDALPMLETDSRTVEQIIVSLSAETVAFGTSAPGITQYFDAYRPENGDCIWEEF